MNKAFNFYGKQPEAKLAKEALIAQSRHNLNDLQLAGLLHINDFFQRIVLVDEHISRVRIDGKRLPSGTVKFFKKFDKCSDVAQFFTPLTAHKTFQKFADSIMSDITKLSDYIDDGLLSIEEEKHVEFTYEMVQK